MTQAKSTTEWKPLYRVGGAVALITAVLIPTQVIQGTAFHVSYVLGSVAGIIIGAVMLRSDIFSRVAAYALVLGDVIGLGLYVPTIGLFISVISVPVLWIWYVLIARRLFQLG